MNNVNDMSDLHKEFGGSSLLTSLSAFRRPAAPVGTPASSDGLPEIISVCDLLNRPTPAPAELITGVLHQGSKMVLGGGSKSFKTWTLLDMAMSVAAGKDWWGFSTHKSPVLYVNLEIADWSFKQRLEAIQTARPELVTSRTLDMWNLRGYSTSLSKLQPTIAQRIQQKYGLVIIDPIYKVYGGRDENCAGEMGELLNEIEALAVTSGAAVVFGAHFSKGNQSGKESIDRISGSGVFARDPDTIMVMTKHECEDTFTVESTLRNFKPIEPFCVQRDHPLMVRTRSLIQRN